MKLDKAISNNRTVLTGCELVTGAACINRNLKRSRKIRKERKVGLSKDQDEKHAQRNHKKTTKRAS